MIFYRLDVVIALIISYHIKLQLSESNFKGLRCIPNDFTSAFLSKDFKKIASSSVSSVRGNVHAT